MHVISTGLIQQTNIINRLLLISPGVKWVGVEHEV